MTRYAKPTTVDEALALLGEAEWRMLAGGTDFYPAQGDRPIRDNVLDINGLDELRGIAEDERGWRIGARTTWTDVLRADLPADFDGLKAAAREVGSVQIQNTGTVAGNLCNASPAADGVPPLLALDAEVELRSASGSRRLPLEEFILGNRRTALQPDELVTNLYVRKYEGEGYSSFLKLGARRYLVISIAMVAVRVVVDPRNDHRINQIGIAVGACSPVAMRMRELEHHLHGKAANAPLALRAKHFEGLSPIDDVRGTAAYRAIAARELVTRALMDALDRASKDMERAA